MRKSNADLLKVLNQIKNKEVAVGYFENSTYADGTPVAYVSAKMELGTMHIPARPTMQPAMKKHKSKYANMILNAVEDAINGGDFENGLMKLGLTARDDIQSEIVSLENPPLANSTILRKGHSKPLMDTKVMFQSVHFKVRNSNEV